MKKNKLILGFFLLFLTSCSVFSSNKKGEKVFKTFASSVDVCGEVLPIPDNVADKTQKDQKDVKAVQKFWDAYEEYDFKGIEETLSHDVSWIVTNEDRKNNEKKGIDATLSFIDRVRANTSKMNFLFLAKNENYVVSVQRQILSKKIETDPDICILWFFLYELDEKNHIYKVYQTAMNDQLLNQAFSKTNGK